MISVRNVVGNMFQILGPAIAKASLMAQQHFNIIIIYYYYYYYYYWYL